jgi:hypothetical protein
MLAYLCCHVASDAVNVMGEASRLRGGAQVNVTAIGGHRIPVVAQKALLPSALAMALLACQTSVAQDGPDPQAKQPEGAAAPVLNVDAGPCIAEFTVHDASGKGVYDAKITMHIEYGFLGMRKLDINLGTNYEGKATIERLPDKFRRPAEFKIAQGGREKIVPYDPATQCYGRHQVVLENPAADPAP